MSSDSILIIDDEHDIRTLLGRIMRLENYQVFEAENARRGLALLRREKIHVVICDVKLPDANGVELVPELRKASPCSEVILLTAFGAIPDSVSAIKSGAYDYITKGDDNNRIIPLVSQALLASKRRYAQQAAPASAFADHYSFEQMVGRSAPVQKAIALARKVAPTDATVLLTGETGTGKEVFAQAIHHASGRAGKAFLAVNCSAFGKEILESEMFGHRAGSFTGATRDKAGLFEEADGGTIFLDEIGEMDLALQAKLLRVLETGRFLKVGETKETRVDVRIIAATNRNLPSACEKGTFRLDLFYRLSVFSIQLPTLRERPDDILPLADHFIRRFCERHQQVPFGMEESFRQALVRHPWNGNIRELKNVIERAVILSTDGMLRPDCLPLDFHSSAGRAADSMRLAAMEKEHIRKVMAYTGGNKTKSAELLGIGLATLYRKIEEYGMQP
ncbi:MAG: hypothetical protein RLY31_1365 [Bacteroidota bacterium]|jgi:two-component system NtrC family response regulator